MATALVMEYSNIFSYTDLAASASVRWITQI